MPNENEPLVELVHIDDLLPDPKNPRTISRMEFASLVKSIDEFGMTQPVVANRRNMQIVGGHMRILAARELKLDKVPVVWVDLDEQHQTTLNIALNKIAGEFDDQMLAELIVDLDDDLLSLTGLSDEEITDLTADPFDEEEKEPVEKTKSRKYTTDELRKLAKDKWPQQFVILEFLDWVDEH